VPTQAWLEAWHDNMLVPLHLQTMPEGGAGHEGEEGEVGEEDVEGGGREARTGRT
jgi:hypothetical protein